MTAEHIWILLQRVFGHLSDPAAKQPALHCRLNERFTQTGLTKASAEVRSLWKEIQQRPAREGKRHDHHRLLHSFALGPSCGKYLTSVLQQMDFNRSLQQESEWISKKQLLDLFSESEAEGLVIAGAVEVRTHPQNPRPTSISSNVVYSNDVACVAACLASATYCIAACIASSQQWLPGLASAVWLHALLHALLL